jgi:prevent-host-death family protein
MHQTPANHVGIFDAKTHLSELIERVRGGESFVLTKHGMPVARLVPAGEDVDPAREHRVRAAFGKLRELRHGVTLGPDVTVRQLIDEGRRM